MAPNPDDPILPPPSWERNAPAAAAVPVPRWPGQPAACSVCDAPLTPHQEVSGGVCDRAYCRRKLALRHAAEVAVELRENQRRRAAEWYEELSRDWPRCYPGGARIAVLPTNPRPLTSLPEDRREGVRDHIRASISSARQRIAELDGEPWTSPPPTFDYPVRERDHPVLAAGCATCRGYCCGLGGRTNAFLSLDVFVPRLLAEPEMTTSDLLAEYMDRIPAMSFEGACVFQGARGCTLSRAMRSDVCNTFLCESLLVLRADLAAHEPRRVFAVAMNREVVLCGALIEDGRLRFRRKPDRD